MKFRTTMLLAALLATAGCGGDDDSSGLLSPTAPSPVTGVAAQDAFTVAWTASAGSLSASSGANTTWNGSTLTASQSATVTATATDSDGAASTATATVYVVDYVSGGGTGPTTPEPPQPPQVDGDCAVRDLTKTEFLPGELYCGQLHSLTEAWTHYARAPRSTGDTVANGILVFTSYNRICAYIGSCRATESDDEVHTSGTSTYQWITVR